MKKFFGFMPMLILFLMSTLMQAQSSEPPIDVFNGIHVASSVNDTLIFKTAGHTVSQREYKLYSKLKGLFKEDKLRLVNPVSDSIVKEQDKELALLYNYTADLESKIKAINKAADDYQNNAKNTISEQRKVNTELSGEVETLTKEVSTLNASWNTEKEIADKYIRKSKRRGKLVVSFGAISVATITYIVRKINK